MMRLCGADIYIDLNFITLYLYNYGHVHWEDNTYHKLFHSPLELGED